MKEAVRLPTQRREVQGNITIELLQGDQVVKTIKKHNYVNHQILQALARINERIGFGMATVGLARLGQLLQMTDNDKDANRKDKFIEGNVIAWADSSATVPPVVGQRGAFIDRTESITSQKFEWEFSETQGNGLIRSIYLGPISGTNPSFARIFSFRLPFTFHYFMRRDGIFYAGNSVRDLYVFDDFPLSRIDGGIEEDLEYHKYQLPNFVIHDMEIVGNELYFVNATNTIRKVSLDDPAEVIDSFTVRTAAVASPQIRGIVYSKKRKEWYMRISNATDILVFDEEFQLLREFPFRSTGTTIGRGINLSECEDYLFYNRWRINLDTMMSTQMSSGTALVDAIYTYNDEFSWEFGNTSTAANMVQTDIIRFSASAEFLSRVLLDEPIMKDGTKKMRVTYEYELPPFSLDN
ncbi:hypothetical protein ACFC9R_07475 [Enterococcus casseliflavus]